MPFFDSKYEIVKMKAIELLPFIVRTGHEILESLDDQFKVNEVHTMVGAVWEEFNEDREGIFKGLEEESKEMEFEDRSWSW